MSQGLRIRFVYAKISRT